MMIRLVILLALLWPGASWAQTWYYPGGEPDTSFGDGTSNAAWTPQNFLYGAAITLPAGTVTRLRLYTDSDGTAGITAKLGLYDSSGNLVVQGSVSIPTGSTKAWNTADVADTSISAGTYYVFGSSSTADMRYGYDSSGNGNYATLAYASAMAATITIDGPDTGLRYGVGAEVADGGGGSARTLLLMGVGP